mmetsp:Transcript_9411/g.31252  ORF Transcript_9411/g.31252 Transcript_9411/m.31252 type:complete len:207 (+) Transcript_9411:530-1150(+)
MARCCLLVCRPPPASRRHARCRRGVRRRCRLLHHRRSGHVRCRHPKATPSAIPRTCSRQRRSASSPITMSAAGGPRPARRPPPRRPAVRCFYIWRCRRSTSPSRFRLGTNKSTRHRSPTGRDVSTRAWSLPSTSALPTSLPLLAPHLPPTPPSPSSPATMADGMDTEVTPTEAAPASPAGLRPCGVSAHCSPTAPSLQFHVRQPHA